MQAFYVAVVTGQEELEVRGVLQKNACEPNRETSWRKK